MSGFGFIQYVRTGTSLLDRISGLSKAQRQAKCEAELLEYRRISDIAVQACGKLTEEEYEALAAYLTWDR